MLHALYNIILPVLPGASSSSTILLKLNIVLQTNNGVERL